MQEPNYQTYPLSLELRGSESPEQQQQLINQLQYRFRQKPRICKKLNDTWIGSNKRIVYVHDDSFYYYHLIQQFQDLDVGKLQYATPKAGIKLKDIISLSFPPRTKKQKNYFSITIPKNKLLKYGKNKQIVMDPNAKGEQVWTFIFNYNIFSLPEKQERMIREQKKLLELEAKRLENERLQKEKKQREQEQRLRQEQEREKSFEKFLKTKQQQKNLRNEQQKQKAKSLKKQKAKTKQQIQKQLMIQQQIQLKIMKKKKLESAFQFFFNDSYMKLSNQLNLNQIMEIQYQILQKIGTFRIKAIQSAKLFIDQLIFHNKIRKYTQYKFGSIVNNILVKVGGKQINQQFLAMKSVSDILSILKKNKGIQIRVPLAALVKYKGYKALCVAQIPINGNQTLIYGITPDNAFKFNSSISDQLKDICKGLNLKAYITQIGYTNYLVYLDPLLEVHKTPVDAYLQIQDILDSLNSSNTHPKLKQKKNSSQFIYLINLKEIFPIDIDLNKNINQLNVRLRPQLIHSMINVSLSSGAFLNSVENAESQEDDLNVAKIGQQLRYRLIPDFVKKIDSLEIIFIDSKNILQNFRNNGINMRYIDKVRNLTQLPYVKQMMEIQMYARCIKKIFRQQIKDFNNKGFSEMHPQLYKALNANAGESDQIYIQSKKKEAKQRYNNISKIIAIDFLNLIFSNTIQTYAFWKIILKSVKQNYKFQTQIIPPAVTFGNLLHSVLYHCNLQVKFDFKIPLFKSNEPFKQQDFVKFTVSSQVYQFPSFQIQKMASKSKQYLLDKNFTQLGIKSLNLQLGISRALQSSVNFQHCALPQQQILLKLSNYTQIQIPQCPPCHPCIIPFHMRTLNQQTFGLILNIIQFSLSITHPLYISFYMEFSKYFVNEKTILYKSALMVAIRGLGISHWKTCQLFTNIDDQKQNIEFYKKAWVGSKFQSGATALLLANKLNVIGNIIQSLQFSKLAIKIFEDQGPKSHKKLSECLMLSIKSYYLLRNLKQMCSCCQMLWKNLEVNDRQNYDLYWQMIWYTLKHFLEDSQKKNYYYKLILVFRDHIVYQRTFQYRQESISQQQQSDVNNTSRTQNRLIIAEDFFAEADPILKLDILNKLIQLFRQSKSLMYWFRDTFAKVQYGYKYLNNVSNLWSNFHNHLQKINNEQLQQGIVNYLLLAKLYGQKYYYDALIKDIFFRPNLK